MQDYQVKLEALATRLQKEQQARLVTDALDCQANINNAVTSIKPGKKYDRIDIGNSGSLMIVKATGEVFGIKAYGVIHRGHAYGTLDTIDDWFWGFYHPVTRTSRVACL